MAIRIRRLLLRIVGLFGRALVRRPLEASGTLRILVIKPDHLGDVLMLTPTLAALRAALPQSHITLAIGPWSQAAVEGRKSFDLLHVLEFPGFTRRSKPSLLQPYALLLRTAVLLRASQYDVALIARDDHWWGALLALLAGIPRRIGYAAPDVVSLLTDALPYAPATHVARQALDLVAHLTGRAIPGRPSMVAPVTTADQRWAMNWLTANGCGRGERLVAIHPGAGGVAKLWVSARWAMVASELDLRGWRIVLTGGPSEHDLVRAIAAHLPTPPLLLVGEATLGQLAALYQRCRLVLGVDSGPMHLATAAGAHTITLFGPIDPHRFGPWGPTEPHHIVRSNLWCSPCGAVDACPRGTRPAECMTTITVSHVLAAIDSMSISKAASQA